MRLTAIHLHGFKSFPERTIFPVDAPLTAILGPNGCGKSNIIDAVRWVLGESAAKQLRGQAMSDVIFAGCASRAASRQASVELHFDNSAGQAGGAFSAFAELVIRREIDGEGQSRYSINKKRCRRRDIIDLLQGSGVGARSYAVIEQGMISRVIEAKPEELRGFIEEAAGIAIYQARRKESERRMAQVNEHLTRHDDRLYDLVKQRARLEQEVEIARQYRDLQRQISDEQHRLASWQYHCLQSQHVILCADCERHEQQLVDVMAALSREEARLPEIAAQAQQAREAQREAAARLRRAQQHEQQISQQQRSQNQALHHINSQIAQLSARGERLAQQVSSDSAQLAAALEEHTAAQQAQEDAQARWRTAQAEDERIATYYRAQQAAYDLAAQQRARDAAAHQQAQAARQRAAERLQALEARIAALAREHSAPEDMTLLVEEAMLAQKTQALALANAEDDCAQAAAARQAAEAALTAAQQVENGAREAYQQANSQYETLQQWAQAAQNEASDDAPRLLDALKVEALWQSALERFLGTRLQAVFQAQGSRDEALAQQRAMIGAGGVPRAWQAIVQSDAALEDWLAHVLPLAQRDSEIDLSALDADQHYLSLDGTLISAHSVVPLRAADHAGSLARSAQRQALAEEVPALARAWQSAQARVAQASAEYAQRRVAYEQAAQHVQTQKTAYQQCANALALRQSEQQHGARLYAQQRDTLLSWQQEREHAHATLMQAEQQLSATPRQADNGGDDGQALATARTAMHDAQQALQQAAQQRQSCDTQLSSLQARIQAYREREARNHAEQADIEAQQQQLHAEQETITLAVHTLEEATFAAQEALLVAENELEVAEQSQHESTQAAQQLERALDRRRHEIDLAQHQMDQYRDRVDRNQVAMAQLQAQFIDSDRTVIVFPEDATLDEAALQRSLKRCRRALSELGAVNLSAIETFSSVDEEYQTLNQQCADLRGSLDQLNAAIAELDGETRQRLQTTMGVINHHFSALFPLLFRGGEAALAWSESEVLSAGVHIRVRPPGKNIKNLSALSGGEKALTAIALVFALFRLNPAPFCLLDEVDAPLDDGNVGRLTALLREMAQHTQFVVITHHKTTMQACDHLIGVTMSEPGISRLVAVRYDQALQDQ